MPIATPQGTLDFKSVDKVTFVGASSNTVIDTTTGSLGVGVDVNGPTSNLHVVGNTRLEGDINMIHTANTASIKLNSNVVTEFPRSKKLIKYPRVAMTGATTAGYTASASNENTVAARYAYKAFDNDRSTEWQMSGTNNSSAEGYDLTSPYNANSNSPTITDNNGIGHTGAWVKLQLPGAIKISSMYIYAISSNRRPDSAILLGSNDDSTWYVIEDTFTVANQDENTISVHNSSYYQYVMLLVKSLTGNEGQLQIDEIEYYGIPEYDPEAHGTDVVVKSVPNVPNTDWLDIYIDGQDYSTMPSGNGSILDKSTNNRHGTPSNVTFNSTWKAFEIESASTSNITIPFNSTGGAYVHTISLWFWMDTTAGGNRCIFTIRGSESTGRQIALIINQDSTSVGFKYDFYSSDVRYYDPSVVANKWMHVTLTYSGGNNTVDSKEIYLNGIKLGVTASGTSPLNLTGTENLIIGGDLNSGNASFEGMVANFRMFNRVLTTDEIYQLYAYQKEYFGHGDLSMTLKAGRLGIGTSEPRAALDVRGSLNFGIPNVHSDSLSGSGSISAATEEAGYAPLGNDMYVVWGNYALAHTGSGQYSWTWYFPNNFTMTVLSAVGTLRDCGYGYSYDRSGLGINGYYTNRISGHTKNDTIGAFTQHIHFVVIGKKV